jgi:hypothetical protein
VAQHDYVIANGTGAAVRSDLNNALAAIVSQNSGATEPATMYAYQWWADTSTGLLKLRNAANNAWITLRELDGTLTIEAGTVSAPGLAFASDLNTGIYSPSADQLAIATNGVERVEWGTTEVVFNDGGTNYDFRIEGDTVDSLFFVDASADAVGLGTSSPSTLLHVSSATGSASPTPTEIRIATSTVAGDWSTTSPWGRLSFYSADTSGSGPKVHAALETISDFVGGNSSSLVFKTTDSSTSSLNERLRIDSSGRVGIGTTTPTGDLHVKGSTLVLEPSAVAVAHRLSFSTADLLIEADVGNGAASNIIFRNDASERARIDSSGRLLVGTSTARDFFGGTDTPALQVEGLGNAGRELSVTSSTAAASGAVVLLAKQRSGAVGGQTIVQSGDQLGYLGFQGSDGAKMLAGAAIEATVDGTPGVNDLPTRLVFSTTADGASSPTERMRINASGQTIVESGTNTFTAITSVAGSVSVACWNKASSGDNKFIDFITEAGYTVRGGIDYNRSAGQVRYNVTSDERLKENIEDASTASTLLSSIKVRSYIWKETGYKVEHGFVAQELNQIVPDAVRVGDDGDEILDAWAVDNGKLVPLLTKALQEAIAKIETLEAKVAALEAS